MMICPNCGKENGSDKFCYNCGTELDSVKVSKRSGIIIAIGSIISAIILIVIIVIISTAKGCTNDKVNVKTDRSSNSDIDIQTTTSEVTTTETKKTEEAVDELTVDDLKFTNPIKVGEWEFNIPARNTPYYGENGGVTQYSYTYDWGMINAVYFTDEYEDIENLDWDLQNLVLLAKEDGVEITDRGIVTVLDKACYKVGGCEKTDDNTLVCFECIVAVDKTFLLRVTNYNTYEDTEKIISNLIKTVRRY